MAGRVKLQFNRRVYGDLKDRVGMSRLANVGVHMQERLRARLTGPRSGRMYGRHQASAPGEPPARETGRLQDSIQWQLEDTTRRDKTVSVGTDLDYGIMLEHGTRRIAPRPWLKITFEEERNTVQSIMDRPWN